jgi:putative ABC transport system substrate-binding protein
MHGIGRREFISLIGGAAAWPIAARSQQRTAPVIGFLRNTLPSESASLLAAIRQGLKEAGFIEGENVVVESRWGGGQLELLSQLAAELVRRPVTVIIAGGNEAISAAKAATASVPIVFATGADPVMLGFVAALNRPEGNVTGASFFSAAPLSTKQIGILHDLIPKALAIGLLIKPGSPGSESVTREVETAAHSFGRELFVVGAKSEHEFEPAFTALIQVRVGALLIEGDALFTSRRNQVVTLAAQHAMPTLYPNRDYVAAGGLMSYGASIAEAYRQAGVYAGRIIKGDVPSDLPIVLPTKFAFTINLKTAEALDLQIPASLLALADEVIE